MSDCRVCMAPITWATTAGGESVPLDDHEERDYGPDRYVVIADGPARPLVQPVPLESPQRTYVDHRVLCQQPRAI